MPLRPARGATDRLAAGRRDADNYAELWGRFPRPPTAESLASNFIDKELRTILQRNGLPWTRGEARGCARLPHAQRVPVTALTATPARSAAYGDASCRSKRSIFLENCTQRLAIPKIRPPPERMTQKLHQKRRPRQNDGPEIRHLGGRFFLVSEISGNFLEIK